MFYYELFLDPDGTQYIRYDQLSDFLDILEPPLQIHKPNKYKIISMDIPICKGNENIIKLLVFSYLMN